MDWGRDKEEKGKKTFRKVTRREALKRIALTTGSIGLLGSLHSWGGTKPGIDLGDLNQPEQQKVAAYYSAYFSYSRYSSYSSYTSFYSSRYSSYGFGSYSSGGYSSYQSIASPGRSQSRGGGCTRS